MQTSLSTTRRSSRLGRLTAALAALVVFAGCANDTGGGASGETDDEALAAAKEAVAAGYDGTYTAPTTTETAPPAGKSVWIISCGQATIGCASLSDGAKEGAEAAGWDATLYDGKLGVDNAYATGVRQAVAAKADAIVISSIDCPLMKAPLEQAKAAGVLVVGAMSYDCDDPRFGGEESLFTSNVIPNSEQTTVGELAHEMGRVKAQWALAQTDAKTVGLSLTHTDSVYGQDIAAGFAEVVEDCGSCRLEPLDFTFADIASGEVPTKVTQALVRNPDVNAVTTPYDSLMVLGVAQALVRSGKSDDISAIGGEAFPENLDMIKRNAGQDAANYNATDWFGWAAIDTLSRLFNDQEPEPAGIGVQLVDAEHMPELDDDGAIVPPFDFRAAYRSAWGK